MILLVQKQDFGVAQRQEFGGTECLLTTTIQLRPVMRSIQGER